MNTQNNNYSPVPRPRNINWDKGRFSLNRKIKLIVKQKIDSKLFVFFKNELKKSAGKGFTFSSTNVTGALEFSIVKSLPESTNNPEAYALSVTSKKITISAVAGKGLFYAFQTLLDLINEDESGSRFIPCCNIADWPEFEWRGFMIDPARCFVPVETIFLYADYMCRAKMNKLHIHFTDNNNYTLPTKVARKLSETLYHDMFRNVPRRPFTFAEFKKQEEQFFGSYSAKDIKRIIKYCQERMIEVIPEICMPSHAAPIVKAFPETKCKHEKDKAPDTVICIGNEKTYEILEKLIAENVKLFPSEYFHIGADEIEVKDVKFRGLPFYCQTWDQCPVCRERMKSEGFATTNELFYYFVGRIRNILAKYGKKLIMWNDYIDLAKPYDLPKDIIQQYWRIAAKQRGPWKGCSFNKLLQSGMKVINSNSLDAYIDEEILIKEKRLIKWHPRKMPYADKKLRKNIIGSEMTAWGLYKHFKRTLPSAITIFGDRLWNAEEIKNPRSFGKMISRHLFGPGLPEEIYRIYEYNGSLIPPRLDHVLAYMGEQRIFPEVSSNELRKVLRMVKNIIAGADIPNRRALKEYAEILIWQISEINNQ